MWFLLACEPAAEDSEKSVSPASEETATLDLQPVLEQMIQKNDGYGGGILRVEKAGKTLFSGASGNAWRGGPAIKAGNSFEIASVTKTITAVTILRLVEEGAFNLDDPIGPLLSYPTENLLTWQGQAYGSELTLRQLLSHTSGLPDYWTDPPYVSAGTNAFLRAFEADPDRRWSPEELLAYVPELNPICKPGNCWHYSDSNYVLLGLLIEETTGQPLQEAYRDLVFSPTGMKDTWLSYHEETPETPVESHRYEHHLDLVEDQLRQSADWAGGGLVSTTEDLSLFLSALADGKLLSEERLAELLEPHPTGEKDLDYGLGVFLIQMDQGVLWGHDGYGGAFAYTLPPFVYTGTINQTDNDMWPLLSRSFQATH